MVLLLSVLVKTYMWDCMKRKTDMKKVAVIGAGPSGLTAIRWAVEEGERNEFSTYIQIIVQKVLPFRKPSIKAKQNI